MISQFSVFCIVQKTSTLRAKRSNPVLPALWYNHAMNKKEKPIVLLDMDGVLADYRAGLYKKWQERYPEEFAEHYIPYEKDVRMRSADTFSGEVLEHLMAIKKEDGMFIDLEPVPGAVESAQKLAERYDVRMCTMPRI
jgi:5'(3')-deoxyribonucleotidase